MQFHPKWQYSHVENVVISHFGKMTEKNDLLSLMRGIKLES
jgi:hypothetical protein